MGMRRTSGYVNRWVYWNNLLIYLIIGFEYLFDNPCRFTVKGTILCGKLDFLFSLISKYVNIVESVPPDINIAIFLLPVGKSILIKKFT